MSYNVTVIIEKDDSGYYAYCTELQGCMSQGDTFEAAMSNIKEAVELYLEVLNDNCKLEI
ncbi:MAG TPA: type II toxin-antitoxin system HicB family antitoxin [Ignavibacteria bacterium]|nr:type II toxin-antitoxin system HicB family antitoxin [Ignavibacteria bacterium]